MKTDVIISAYNNPKVLSLVLQGYLLQTSKSFGIIIADDGSTQEIKKVCDIFKQKGLNITHIWHEDRGFRRAEIVNKAIRISTADYIILTDSDCFPHRYFIADHKALAESKKLVAGRRVDLKEELTQQFFDNKKPLSFLNSTINIISYGFRSKLKRAEFGIRYPRPILQFFNLKQRSVLGANMATWRKYLIEVNGFDNDFIGYGFEESDLEWRLHQIGITNKSAIGRAILFHFYHTERQVNNDTIELFNNRKLQGVVKAKNGIFKL